MRAMYAPEATMLFKFSRNCVDSVPSRLMAVYNMMGCYASWWRYWPFVRWIQRSPHKGPWGGALMFSFLCAWINGWVNNGAAGDLRHHRTHCDVTVMCTLKLAKYIAVLIFSVLFKDWRIMLPYIIWHKAITWTCVDLSLLTSSDIYLVAMAEVVPQPWVINVSLKIN